jgi:hypothetical protein
VSATEEETLLLRRVVTVSLTIRDAEGNRNGFVRREINLALRWMAPQFEQVPGRKGPENPPVVKALHDLDQGVPVAVDRVRTAVAALRGAAAYYRDESPPEPFEGRNAEAAADLDRLAETLELSL